jgi:hydrogenase maturation protease
MSAVVIGIGNEYRRDDGVGPAVAAELARRGVRVEISDGDPVRLMDAWAGVDLAVVVDAVRCVPSQPGRLHRANVPTAASATSSHGFGVPEAVELARVLDRLPARLVVFAVEVDDVAFGVGLSPLVAVALGSAVDAVLAELATADEGNLAPGSATRDGR